MQGLNALLKKLIRSGAGRKRYFMAVTGLSVAILLILSAVQLQANYQELLHSKNNKDSIANFLVINKTLTDQNIGATGLNEKDLADLRDQPFVEEVGLLMPSRFKASIQSSSERFPFYTDIAFEAVPDAFIDVSGKDWTWEEGKPYVPIIVPNMFLDFYNFQFSFSQNLPQLTQQVVKMIGFRINIYGAHGMTTFNGRIVGFSDRISSLLVPQPFMDWANKTYGGREDVKPSRVIIRTKDPGNPQLVDYLQQKQLATDNDKTRFSRYRQVVDLVVHLSWLTGAVMLVFALLIFTLFIQLTVASCKEEVILLLTLGASPLQLRRFLLRLFLPANFLVVILGLVVVSLLQIALGKALEDRHIYLSHFISPATILAATGILGMVSMVIVFSVKKNISDTN